MTNEIEKQFFDKFGIEPKKGCTAYDKLTEEEADAICNDKCTECSYLDDVYPKIMIIGNKQVVDEYLVKCTGFNCEQYIKD